jgi:hypothetical protein
MEMVSHNLNDLFKQLGLPHGNAAIRRFCREHYIPADERLADAQFWNAAQAQFIREAWQADADWVEVIDQLDACLRH